MSFQIGNRVRLREEIHTCGGKSYPIGAHGVVVDTSPGLTRVQLDTGDYIKVVADELEVYTPVFASHYQAQPILDEPAQTAESSLSGDELMNITRSFCR